MRTDEQKKADAEKAKAGAMATAKRLAAALKRAGAKVSGVKAGSWIDATIVVAWPDLGERRVAVDAAKSNYGWDYVPNGSYHAKWPNGRFRSTSRRVSEKADKLAALAADIVQAFKDEVAANTIKAEKDAKRAAGDRAAAKIKPPAGVTVYGSRSNPGRIVVTLPDMTPELAAKVADAVRPLFEAP